MVKNAANAGDTRDPDSIPRSGRSSGVGNGNPLQYSCLGSPKDTGAWQATVCACMLSHFACVWLFATLWTVALQAPLSMGFSRQEYWRGCCFLLQGTFRTWGSHRCLICLLHWQAGTLAGAPPGKLDGLQFHVSQRVRQDCVTEYTHTHAHTHAHTHTRYIYLCRKIILCLENTYWNICSLNVMNSTTSFYIYIYI